MSTLWAEEETEDPKWNVSKIPGEAKTVSIDTDNGTWMSLDVSPDGKTMAFDLLGDIYLLPMSGGEARSINSGLAWSMQPRFSPDGSEIAFISDAGGGDNIWIMQADGIDAKQLTTEDFRLLNNPSWSPDGRYLADMVIIDANVLEDIYQTDHVSQVMLNGRLYDAKTLNETVTGTRKTRPFYWQ